MKSITVLFVLSATFGGVGSAVAQDGTVQRPALIETLLACRSVVGEAQRLVCFDRAAAAFETAEAAGEVTVVDQAQARQTRQRLFGLDLDAVNIFGNLRDDTPVEAIETTLVGARQNHRDQWTFELADGSTWLQIDTNRLMTRAEPGAPVRIRQAALGSYMLSISGARSLRVRRER
ncbi:hypothetical protein [Brevundimonas bacteroides]|uniref:hypothetical protein n=1 Tax=Brevundimonas bacteroides TaxID=74311 RepID=UPI00069210B8|nr:hypothetical protein [Brevundimonas bacteroides]